MLEMARTLGAALFYQNGQQIANFFIKHSEQPDMSPDGWQSLRALYRAKPGTAVALASLGEKHVVPYVFEVMEIPITHLATTPTCPPRGGHGEDDGRAVAAANLAGSGRQETETGWAPVPLSPHLPVPAFPLSPSLLVPLSPIPLPRQPADSDQVRLMQG